MANVLEVFTDFVCPWCYLGEKHLQQALRNHDVTVQYVYFPLHPETSVEGMTLEQLFAGRGLDVATDQEQLGTIMRGEGLEYGQRTHTYNSRSAQELAKYIEIFDSIEGSTKVSQFRSEVFLAYFARGENIAKADVLQEICRSIGMLELDVEIALTDSKAAAAVDEDWASCRKKNVSGVPAFRFGEDWVYGCRGVDALESLIRVEGDE
ncbi:MAG: DsbA family oxidoreductase [Pirellulales bacterium]|jgi:predicted DsbA family dithiol-disulfide isomerase